MVTGSPRLVPEEPTFATQSEQHVWEILRSTLGPTDILLANQRLTDETKDHEADLIVVMPGVGIVVLEIKGGSVWHDTEGWHLRSGNRSPRSINPVDQVRDAKYAVRRYVEQDPRWPTGHRVAWAHGVVLPWSDFPADFSLPELPRWTLHDRNDLSVLVDRLRTNGSKLTHGQPAPTAADVDLIVEILAGRSRTRYDVNAEAAERAAEADRLTQDQATILRATRLLNRVEIRGGAGSGKTMLALAQAKDLTRGRSGERPAQRVALLCYSIGLAEYFKREVNSWPRRQRPAFVGTFHDFGRQWGAPDGDRNNSNFWEVDLPQTMADLAHDLPDQARFDSIIVDEAQDFAETWWRPILRALRDEETSGLSLYSDENQRIFARFGRPPVPLIPLVLDQNLRNTKQIHESFGPLAPSRMYARGGDGPAVRFVEAAVDDALGVADDQVDALLDAGWSRGNIALLTTGHRHNLQLEAIEFHGHERYWNTYFDGEDVFYGHVLGCKGLERPAVILCLNEQADRERARERLYVGMSRATDQLIVVGDPDHVRRVGGPEVARRLNISSI